MNTTFTTNKPKFTFKKVLAASIIAISLPLATLALAQDDGPNAGKPDHKMDRGSHCEKGARMHHGMGKPGVPHYLRDVTLTSAQEDQLFTLMHAQMPIMRDQHKQEIQLRQELRTASQADKFDEAKVQQLADKLANLDKEKTMMRAHNEAKIFALLTPEQRVKAREAKIHKRGFRHGDAHGERSSFKQKQHRSDSNSSDASRVI
ncbi:MAG: Spy/CpxP family protein refolding chaperone [Methylotenera sp.]